MKIQRSVISSIFSLARLPFIDLIYKYINFTLLIPFILHLINRIQISGELIWDEKYSILYKELSNQSMPLLIFRRFI